MLTDPRFWLGLAFTAGFFAVLFLLLRVDFGELTDALAEANYAYLAPSVAIYFASFYARSVRWRFLLEPFAGTKAARLYPVILVGYTANNLLPMRVGEIARSYYLASREPVPGSTALATIVVERVLDGLTLLLLLLLGALFLPLSDLTDRIGDAVSLPAWLVPLAALPFLGGLALIVWAAVKPGTFLGLSRLLTRRAPHRFQAAADGLTERFLQGFEGLHRPSRLAGALLLSLPVWLAEGTVYYLIALGFGLDGHFDSYWLLLAAVLVVVALSNLATSLPSSQGSVGPFEFFAVLALVYLGVGSGLASAYALVLHAALILPVIAVGLVYLGMRSITLVQLTRGRAGGAVGERP